MANLTPEAHIEMEIHRILNSGISLDLGVQQIVDNYQNSKLTRGELEAISIFFLQAGYHHSLSLFLLNALERGLNLPWAHFTEALFLTTPAIPESVKAALVAGAEAQNQIADLARVVHLDHFDDRLRDLRLNRRELHRANFMRRREQMISTIEVLQAQGMSQEQARQLEKFNLLFPEDKEVARLKVHFEKKRNIQLVDQIKDVRQPWIPILAYDANDRESLEILSGIETSMNEYLDQNSNADLSYDFSIAHMMWENYPAALNFVEYSLHHYSKQKDKTKNVDFRRAKWLQLDILFQMRRFVEILDEVARLEPKWADDPDATFGLLYLRATSLWELSQKQHAIEIMESVTLARPHFRSANILLAEWRGEAT